MGRGPQDELMVAIGRANERARMPEHANTMHGVRLRQAVRAARFALRRADPVGMEQALSELRDLEGAPS